MTIDVYVLHFDRPVGRCSHYIGQTRPGRVEARMREHLDGRGSHLTARAVQQSIGWTLVKVVRNVSTETERRLKNVGSAKRLCPICRGEPLQYGIDGVGNHYQPKPKPPVRQFICFGVPLK